MTVGMGCEALVCVADRDVSTGNIIPGRFSQRIPLDAAALLPGGATAAKACAASLRANATNTHNPDAHVLRVYPSCVFSSGSRLNIGNQSERDRDLGDTSAAAAGMMSTVRVTFPATALAGCALRCRVNGRALPISIVSADRDTTTVSDPYLEMEMMTLVVKIAATGVDGVAMLELVRSSSHRPGGPGLEQPLHPHLYPRDDQDDLDSDDHSIHASHALLGVPAGLPATPVLLASNPEVYAALEEILALKEKEQSDSSRHAGTLYAVGAIMLRGTAPPRQAFQFACWAATKGQMGRALTPRLLDLYPIASMITSTTDAANYLLHAAASGDLETVLAALYHCQEAAELQGFDVSELAILPVGIDGETALHRAAALHVRGGDADVMYELFATLAKPLAWSMGSPDRPKLTGSSLLSEAVGAAAATLVRIVRRYPQSTLEACTPAAATEIIREAVLACPFPVGATAYESARAALTLEILSTADSATRLLNVAAHFNATNGAAASTASDVSASDHVSISSARARSAVPLVGALSTGTVETAFVAAACARWPMLGRGRSVGAQTLDLYHWFRLGVMGGMRRFGKVKSWLARHGPNGNSSLFFDYDPELERIWMDARAKTQVAMDHTAFAFLVLFQCVHLLRTGVLPLLRSTHDQVTEGMTVVEFFLRYLPTAACTPAALLISFKVFPLWYIRNRETVICGGRLMAMWSVIGPRQQFLLTDASPLRLNTMFFTLNMFPIFYPIRADRHLYLQVINTLLMFSFDRGDSYTTVNFPLRTSLAGASFVIMLLLEVQSRHAFALEHAPALAAERTDVRTERQGKHARGRRDWFKWGSSDDYDAGKQTATNGDGRMEAQTKRA